MSLPPGLVAANKTNPTTELSDKATGHNESFLYQMQW